MKCACPPSAHWNGLKRNKYMVAVFTMPYKARVAVQVTTLGRGRCTDTRKKVAVKYLQLVGVQDNGHGRCRVQGVEG